MQIVDKAKPLLRGVSHQAAFFVALAAGVWLLASVPNAQTALDVAPYLATLLALFGVSALYHRIHWSAPKRLLMKRLDHATIFVFIAGSYTPICLLAIGGPQGERLLWLAWLGAGVGVARAVFWPHAPKPLTAVLYVLLGVMSVPYMAIVQVGLGAGGVAALVMGGVLYIMGAVVYALRRPDPFPTIFGYHEIFHALVVLACILHFGAIAHLVLLPRS